MVTLGRVRNSSKIRNPVNTSAGKHTNSVLIVDDHAEMRQLVEAYLTSEGYKCHTAPSVEEAWAVIRSHDIHCILLDVQLTGLTGIEMIRPLQEEHSDIAIIMMTAVDDPATALEAVRAGAYGYITKPFTKISLIVTMLNAFHRRRLELENKLYQMELQTKIQDQTQDIQQSREEIALRLIAAQSMRHDETGEHVRRLGLYAEAMGKAHGCTPNEIQTLRMAAPMHDVGKIGIADAILLKPGPLTEDEYEQMKQHTVFGAKILSGSDLPLLEVAQDIALHHHERWDGNGYPDGLAGADIGKEARIVAILDVYDALSSERVYRKAMPEESTLKLIREGKGSHFEPQVHDLFFETLPELREILAANPEPPIASHEMPVGE